MISVLMLTASALAVLGVYTAIGRLAIPPQERLPLSELGWAGWTHTVRRGFAVSADRPPPGSRNSL